jgi:diguanylate cyclase (GGDEF)-like protein
MSNDGYTEEGQSATERLLEESWEARKRRASQRELIVEMAAAAAFITAAALLLAIGGIPHLRLEVAVLLVGVYSLAGQVEFPVGAGYVVPTQVVLVPMLVLLPPAAVPIAVALGLVISTTVDYLRDRVPGRRVLSAVPDAWHATGAALVLVIAGSPRIGFPQLPLLGGAFAAGCITDLVASLSRMRLAGAAPSLRLQMRVIGLVWVVDASLAPLGFLAAIATRQGFVAILFVLPLVFLLWLLARDRSQRIDQAHRRLKLVEQERERLQSAVRRLGDAFAAKLDLGGLLEILLHGSVEALDASAGRLDLDGSGYAQELLSGPACWIELLDRQSAANRNGHQPLQIGEDEIWKLSLPITIAGSPEVVTGTLRFVRGGRAFESDEIALIAELISKAQLSAAEILAHHEIREQAITDALTGLGNRRKLAADLAAALEGSTSDEASLLLLFDLDGFKSYNDTFGHVAGDALLSRLGAKLELAVGETGDAYRLGGDEFCAHLRLDGPDPDDLIFTAAGALSESGSEFKVRASLGVVLLPHEADSAEHALQLADERMYADKRSQPSGARNQAREVLLRTMQVKQPNLDEHSSRVAELATRVARHLGLSGEALDEIARAAELHDVGKVGIPDAILNKPAALDDGEWEFIYQHTILGERILHGAPALRPVARLVRATHERWDGRGYPDGLAGEEIPLGARIVSVCDAYEAMTTSRTYRSALPEDVAWRELRRGSGSQFDPSVVEAFLIAIENGINQEEVDTARDAAFYIRKLLSSLPARAAGAPKTDAVELAGTLRPA